MEGEADGEVDDAAFGRAFESVRTPALLLDGSFRVRAANDAAVSFTGTRENRSPVEKRRR